MRRLDVLASIGLVALGLAVLIPARARSQDSMNRKKCTNGLRQIALAAIQYCDDKRYFPHLSPISKLDHDGSTTPAGSDVAPRCLRALVFFNYIDNDELFCCPDSDDRPCAMSDETKKDVRFFGWGGEVNELRASPIAHALPNDLDADKLNDLSYSWTVAGHTATARSTNALSSDRARRAGAGAKQTIAGNHRDGWNIVCVDGHTEWLKSGSEDAPRLASTAADGFKLVAWDDAAAGGPAPEKPRPAADPAANEKAKRLLEVGGFAEWIKGDIALAIARLRSRADDPEAAAKWEASLDTAEVFDRMRDSYARHIDGKTLDAAIAFYETPAGKKVVEAQLAVSKAWRLALLTEPERRAREGAGGRSREDPRFQEPFPLTPASVAGVYRDKLSPAELDAAIAFYVSAAGVKYSKSLGETIEETQEILRAWFETRAKGGGAPFIGMTRERNEVAAIGALKTICTSQSIFREGDKDGNGQLDYGTLEALGKAELIDKVLASGKKNGYLFEVDRGNPPEFLWWATAVPEKPGETGARWFFMNQSGVVYFSDKPFPPIDTKKCEPPAGAKPVGK